MARVDRSRLGSWVALALTAACSSSGGSAPGGHGGAVAHGGHGGAPSSSASSSSSSAIATVGSGGFGGTVGFGGFGGVPATTCDPPPDPSTLWAQKAVAYPASDDVTLCPYVGDVLLVVNTAAV